MKLATLCYVRRGAETLMLHRVKKENDYHAGKWTGLGGKLEPGETPEECALREVYEESGLVCRHPRLRGFITFPLFDGIDDWYTFLFTFDSFSGALIDSAEGTLAWIDDALLLELNLWPGDRIFLPWVFQERIFSARFSYTEGQLISHQVAFYPPDGAGARETAHHGSDPAARFLPLYRPQDDQICWLCDGPVQKRHCKIICSRCGFTRDCSDP